jgi:hypothetical protein
LTLLKSRKGRKGRKLKTRLDGSIAMCGFMIPLMYDRNWDSARLLYWNLQVWHRRGLWVMSRYVWEWPTMRNIVKPRITSWISPNPKKKVTLISHYYCWGIK